MITSFTENNKNYVYVKIFYVVKFSHKKCVKKITYTLLFIVP